MFIQLTNTDDGKSFWLSADHILTIHAGSAKDSIIVMTTGQQWTVFESVESIIALIDERAADH